MTACNDDVRVLCTRVLVPVQFGFTGYTPGEGEAQPPEVRGFCLSHSLLYPEQGVEAQAQEICVE